MKTGTTWRKKLGAMITASLLIGAVPSQTHALPTESTNQDRRNIDHITSVKYANQGAVKNIFVQHGDTVHNGQIIARIERQDILDQIKVNEKKLEGYQKMQEVIQSSRKTGNAKARVQRLMSVR